jgi:aminopeptidase-like protein
MDAQPQKENKYTEVMRPSERYAMETIKISMCIPSFFANELSGLVILLGRSALLRA